MTTTIQQADLIESIAAALQYISYYHPADYIAHLARAYELEQGPAAKDAIAQILTNSRMCAEGRRPICQDTGIVNVFLKIGMDVRFDGFPGSVDDAVNDGVRKAYLDADNPLRASIVADPHFERRNTRDNTPAVVHVQMVPGNTVDVRLAAKGGGSENKSKFKMMNPSDSIVDWVLEMIPQMGAGWCPPGMLGIGIGGTAEKSMLLAKESLMGAIDMAQLKERGPSNDIEALRIEIFEAEVPLGGPLLLVRVDPVVVEQAAAIDCLTPSIDSQRQIAHLYRANVKDDEGGRVCQEIDHADVVDFAVQPLYLLLHVRQALPGQTPPVLLAGLRVCVHIVAFHNHLGRGRAAIVLLRSAIRPARPARLLLRLLAQSLQVHGDGELGQDDADPRRLGKGGTVQRKAQATDFYAQAIFRRERDAAQARVAQSLYGDAGDDADEGEEHEAQQIPQDQEPRQELERGQRHWCSSACAHGPPVGSRAARS